MLSIKEIKQHQCNEYIRITELAETLHPKLIRRLTYDDIMDVNLNPELCEKMYNNKIRNEVHKYNLELRKMLNEHLNNFIEGWVLVNSESRWGIEKSDASICSTPDVLIMENFDKYIFDVQIEDYCNSVHDILSDCVIKPFWNYSYQLYGNGIRQNITAASNASTFITNVKKLFKKSQTNYEVLEQLAKDSYSLPYKMKLPPMNIDISRELKNGEIATVVEHHKVLYNFIKTFGRDDPEGGYYSTQYNGDVINFIRNDIK